MHERQKEIHHLQKLLTTRLTPSDRKIIEARIQELMSAQQPNEPKTERLSPFLLGVFDRPAPAPPPKTISEPPTPKPHPREDPPQLSSKGNLELQPPTPSLSPEEIERRCIFLTEIGSRIVLLRAVWATTLSFEVAREAEAWLSKLQEIARTIPQEAAERTLGRHAGFLTQAVQPMTKPQIPEALQQRLLPPSVPNDWNSASLTELYFSSRAYEHNAEKHRPPNSLPDGLDQFIL